MREEEFAGVSFVKRSLNLSSSSGDSDTVIAGCDGRGVVDRDLLMTEELDSKDAARAALGGYKPDGCTAGTGGGSTFDTTAFDRE